MIFKTSSPISPDVEVAIDSVATNYLSLQRIYIEEKEDAHTLMVLDFTGLSPDLITEYVDKPIQISIEFPNLGGNQFIGYIVFLEPSSITKDGLVNSSPFQVTRMYCMGASYVMKSRKSRAWENVTLPEIATTIADTYKFAVSVPQDDYRFTRLVQAGQSDWSFLVSTASKLGYVTLVEGTHIHIWDPYEALGRKSSFGVLKTIAGSNGNVTPDVGQVLRFEGRIGAVTTSGARIADTLHLLDHSGNILTVGGSLLVEQSGLGTPVESIFTDTVVQNADTFEMGTRLVSGALRKKFSMQAYVDITGNPTLRPGGIVQLEKYESKFDGLWYIRGVRHEITRSELITILDVAKDSTADTAPIITQVSEYTKPPVSAILNGTWVAERKWDNVYV